MDMLIVMLQEGIKISHTLAEEGVRRHKGEVGTVEATQDLIADGFVVEASLGMGIVVEICRLQLSNLFLLVFL